MTGKEKQRRRAAARTCAGDPKRCCTTQGNSHQKQDKERYTMKERETEMEMEFHSTVQNTTMRQRLLCKSENGIN